MEKKALHILRTGLGITFFWIGVSIFQYPDAWGNFIQPWAAALLPVPVREMMLGTAALDCAIGALLILNSWTWIAALVASLHLVSILVVSGIDLITVRDIGLLGATAALMLFTMPNDMSFRRKPESRPEHGSRI